MKIPITTISFSERWHWRTGMSNFASNLGQIGQRKDPIGRLCAVEFPDSQGHRNHTLKETIEKSTFKYQVD